MAEGTRHKAAEQDETGSSAIRHLPSAISTWPRMYTLVLTVLAAEILLFYAFTRAFQ
jgi:hypothetical protein